jgi:hypothetical protein
MTYGCILKSEDEGGDEEQILVTLCAACHASAHS